MRPDDYKPERPPLSLEEIEEVAVIPIGTRASVRVTVGRQPRGRLALELRVLRHVHGAPPIATATRIWVDAGQARALLAALVSGIARIEDIDAGSQP